jgi:hypothetical protein
MTNNLQYLAQMESCKKNNVQRFRNVERLTEALVAHETCISAKELV